MWTTTYTILFTNERARSGKYWILTAPPIVSTGADVFTSTWMSFPPMPNYTREIETTGHYYPWIGLAPSSPTPAVVLHTMQSLPSRPGSKYSATRGNGGYWAMADRGQNYLIWKLISRSGGAKAKNTPVRHRPVSAVAPCSTVYFMLPIKNMVLSSNLRESVSPNVYRFWGSSLQSRRGYRHTLQYNTRNHHRIRLRGAEQQVSARFGPQGIRKKCTFKLRE
ncbi:hypothetical protein Q9L58_009725 [Maublancomyces gigas]|uniref:Uncharacterized protein n=1 Tax=Discina gigas TaxID=1032678 RepID=A0ABR3G6S1_9PEZI